MLCSCLASCLAWGVQHWSLLVIEWSWVLALGWSLWESSCRLILWGAGRSLVDQCPELSSAISDAQAWHLARAPRPCQPHGQVRGEFLAFGEVWGLLPVFSRCSVGVVPHADVFLMYSWGGRWSPRLTPLPSSDGWISFKDSMLTTLHPPNSAKITFHGNPLHSRLGLFSVFWNSSCSCLLGLLHRAYFHLSRNPILASLVTHIAGLWLLNHPG